MNPDPLRGASVEHGGGPSAPGPRRPWLAAAAVLVLAVFVVSQLRVVLDISAFMLAGGETKLIKISKQIATSELTRTLIVLVEGRTRVEALDGARRLEARLRADPAVMDRVQSIEGGPPEGIEEALWTLYQPRRFAFVATSSAAAIEAVSPAGLGRALDDLLARLRTPMSTLVTKVAPEDPLLVMPRLFERVASSQQGGLRVADGRYLSTDGRRGVLFIRTVASAFNGGAHAPLLEAIDAAFAGLDDPNLALQLGGLHRFAVRVEQSIKADITRVSVLSAVGLMLLFLVLFRSLRVVGLTLCIVTVGMVLGLAASLAVFGRVHGLTLAFGASMIGVSIDYAVHFFVHHTVAASQRPPQVTLHRIWPGLLLGATTTVAGFAGLAGAGLPGLQEVSVFASAGILGALSATWLFLPALAGRRPYAATAEAMSRRLGAGLERMAGRSSGWSWLLLGGAVVLIGLGAPLASWDDDVARLTHLDPALIQEEETVRAQVAPFEQRRFVVAEGGDLQEALKANEQVAKALEAGVQAGELSAFRSLAVLLPSTETQRRVAEAVRSAADPAVLRSVAVKRGFRSDAFDAFAQALAGPSPPVLTFEELAASPLGGLVRSFRLDAGGRQVVLTYLIGVQKPEALQARLARVPGALWFDQSDLYRDANRTYRRRTVWGLAVGLLVVILLVAVRYRRPQLVAAAVAPAGLAVALTISALGAAGLPLNIVALTALLMVFSMGVDYGVFLAEARGGDVEDLGATLLAVVVAWASTLLGFGLLALSAHPAMRTIGLTASIGVTSSLLLAPTAFVLVRRSRKDTR